MRRDFATIAFYDTAVMHRVHARNRERNSNVDRTRAVSVYFTSDDVFDYGGQESLASLTEFAKRVAIAYVDAGLAPFVAEKGELPVEYLFDIAHKVGARYAA